MRVRIQQQVLIELTEEEAAHLRELLELAAGIPPDNHHGWAMERVRTMLLAGLVNT